jgi:N-methylhydantoinase A
MLSDLVFTAGRVKYIRTDAPDFSAVEDTLRVLAAEISADMAELQPDSSQIDYWVEARYPQQNWEIETPLRTPLAPAAELLQDIVRTFHNIHGKLYAVCDRSSPVEIIGWRAKASCRLGRPGRLRLVLKEARNGKHTRKIFLGETGWTAVEVQPLHTSEDAGQFEGPALVESPFTTIFVPRGCRAARLANGALRAELRQG